MSCYCCSLVSLIVFGVIFLLIGIPCWIVGSFTPSYYVTSTLTSIPVYPNTSMFGYYVPFSRVEYPDGYPDDAYVEISYQDIEKPRKTHDLYLLHNFWGYSLNISIYGGERDSEFSFFQERNMNNEGPFTTPDDKSGRSLLPPQLKTNNYISVKCPNSTIITKERGIEPKCTWIGGYHMVFHDSLELLHIGQLKFSTLHVPLRIVFHNFKALPIDFIHIPQIYYGSWLKTNRTALIIVGCVFFVIGLLTIIAMVIIMACLNESSTFSSA